MKKHKQNFFKIYSILIILVLLTPLLSVKAFDPNFIITKEDLIDYNSLSLGAIQRFLQNHPGILDRLIVENEKKQLTSPAEIIYLASRKYKINPKYLLTLLQKEQSLIVDSHPTQDQLDWATGYALCDYCSKTDPSLLKFKGFSKQIISAAAQMQYYLMYPDDFYYKAGKSYMIDNHIVKPHNDATAALYNYTPHIHGNKNFYKIWNNWFSMKYPNGAILKAKDNPDIWLIQKGVRRKFVYEKVFFSRYNKRNIIEVNQNDLYEYKIGNDILYGQYALLKNEKNKIYLLIDNTLYPFASQKVYNFFGYKLNELIKVDQKEIDYYDIGEEITLNNDYPQGILLQDNKTGGVYYVQNNTKHPIWTKNILNLYFKDKKIIPISKSILNKYNDGSPVKLKNGELATSENAKSVYFISNGQKRPISSLETFLTLGFKWSNVLWVDDKILNLHPLGDPIENIE